MHNLTIFVKSSQLSGKIMQFPVPGIRPLQKKGPCMFQTKLTSLGYYDAEATHLTSTDKHYS